MSNPKMTWRRVSPSPDRAPRWIWAAGGAAVGLVLLLMAVWLGPLLVRPQEALPLPEVTVIPYPTATAIPTATAQPTMEATSTELPSLKPGGQDGFLIGELVDVRNTDGDALRLRSAPSLSASIVALGSEFEVFEVRDGPVNEDGYRWWLLASPYEDNKQGWAVDVFLEPLQTP
ncbi:MAG: hypothetical protein PVJ07_00865 [Anaerolineales bacterium]